MGSRGEEHSEVQGFWAINYCQMSMLLYPSCDTGRSNWHWVQGRSSPEAQGFWAINNCQMSMLLYLICDTGRSRIGVGSRGRSPQKLRVLYVKLSSDEHILNLFCDTGRYTLGVANSRGVRGEELRGFTTLNYRQMSIFYTLIVTLAGHELVWGPGAEPPENSGVLGNKLLSDEHAFYTLFGDNGRSPIGVGSRVRSTKKPGVLGNK